MPEYLQLVLKNILIIKIKLNNKKASHREKLRKEVSPYFFFNKK